MGFNSAFKGLNLLNFSFIFLNFFDVRFNKAFKEHRNKDDNNIWPKYLGS